MISFIEVRSGEERDAACRQFDANYRTIHKRSSADLSQIAKDDLIVDENHRRVSALYAGRAYLVLDVLAKERSIISTITRVCIGSILAMATLGLSLCFQGGRNLFASRHVVAISIPLDSHDADSTLAGISPKQVKAVKIKEKTADEWENASIYKAEIWLNSTQFEGDLDAVEIRDILQWLPTDRLDGNISDFTKAEYLSIEEMARQALA